MSTRVRCSIPPPRRPSRPWVDHVQVVLSLASFMTLAILVAYALLERT